MSVLGALWSRDGAPVLPQTLQAMAESMRYQRRAAGPRQTWFEGAVGFVSASSGFTPDVLLTSGGASAGRSGCWIVTDCRLDNREELIDRLGCDRSFSDAQLVLACYLAWGRDCVSRLDGDFSFVIWDPTAQRLFFGRDAFGMRQLFYTVTTTEVVVATTLKGVVQGCRRAPALNLPRLTDFVTARSDTWTPETVRASVLCVPPGATVEVCDGNATVHEYYHPGRIRVVAGPANLEEAAAGFAELFERSVRARLRGGRSVGVLLSGGLDSAAVACEAARLRPDESDAVIRTYTSVFDETPSADERPYLEAVMKFRPDLRSRQVVCDDRWAFREFADDGAYPFDEPDGEPNRTLLKAVCDAAGQDNCTTVLSGSWADQLLASWAYTSPRYLWDLSTRRCFSEWRHFRASSSGWRFFARLILGDVMALRHSGGSAVGGLRSDLSRRGADTARILRSGTVAAGMSLAEVLSAGSGVQWRSPFLSKDLVNFVLGLPTEWCLRDGETKSMLRIGLRHRLPTEVLGRRSAGHFSDLSVRGLRAERERLSPLIRGERMLSLKVCPRSLIDNAVEAVERDPNHRNVGQLARLVSTERWLALNA